MSANATAAASTKPTRLSSTSTRSKASSPNRPHPRNITVPSRLRGFARGLQGIEGRFARSREAAKGSGRYNNESGRQWGQSRIIYIFPTSEPRTSPVLFLLQPVARTPLPPASRTRTSPQACSLPLLRHRRPHLGIEPLRQFRNHSEEGPWIVIPSEMSLPAPSTADHMNPTIHDGDSKRSFPPARTSRDGSGFARNRDGAKSVRGVQRR